MLYLVLNVFNNINMRKFIILTIILIFPLFIISASTADPVLDPDEVIFDNECARRKLLATPASSTASEPICNLWCKRSIINSGQYCAYGSEDTSAGSWDGDLEVPLRVRPVDAALIYIRAALYAVMGAVAVAVVFYGLFGWYTHAISEGKPDKLEEVKKIYTNTIIGTVIIVMSFVVVQLISVFFGVTESVFDLNFIPKSGFEVEVRESDVGRVCFAEQSDKSSEGGLHTCIDGRWQ